MNVRVCFFGLLAVTVLIIGLPALTRADDLKIVPGERIGDVTVTMSLEDIQKLLGSPSRVAKTTGGTQTLYEWQNRQIRAVQSNATGELISVRTYYIYQRTNSYRTDKGIGITTPISQARQAYGDAGCTYTEEATSHQFAWRELGITFFVWTIPGLPSEVARDRIAEISVRRSLTTPTPAGTKGCP